MDMCARSKSRYFYSEWRGGIASIRAEAGEGVPCVFSRVAHPFILFPAATQSFFSTSCHALGNGEVSGFTGNDTTRTLIHAKCTIPRLWVAYYALAVCIQILIAHGRATNHVLLLLKARKWRIHPPSLLLPLDSRSWPSTSLE